MLVSAEQVLGLRVLERAASDDIDEDEGDCGDNEGDVGLAPFLAKVAQRPGPAGVAAVAQLALVVAPGRAVRVCCRVAGVYPQRRVHVGVAAGCWGFAAP